MATSSRHQTTETAFWEAQTYAQALIYENAAQTHNAHQCFLSATPEPPPSLHCDAVALRSKWSADSRLPVPAQFASRPTLYSLLPPTSCAVFTSFMMSLCAAHFFRSQTERSLRVAVVAHSCSGTVFISQNTFRYTCGKVTFFHLYF